MVGISIGEGYRNAIRFFRQHRIQLDRMGIGRRPIYLAGIPPPSTGRSLAPSAHPPQLSLYRVGVSGARCRIAWPAVCLAHSAAYGDIIAAILALLALILLPSTSGVVMAWIFNVWGTADLFIAFYQANHAGLMAGQLGATYFIPTFIVPLLLITHGLGFLILLRHENESVMREARQAT